MKKIIIGVFLATSLAFSTQAESDDSDDLRFHKAAMYIMEFCDGEMECFVQMTSRFKQRQPGMQYKPNKEYEKYELRRYREIA